MKRIFCLLMFVSLFSGCSKDDADEEKSLTIVGRWEVQKKIYYDYDDNDEVVDEIIYEPNESIWDFRSDGNLFIYDDNDAFDVLEITYESDADMKELVILEVVYRVQSLTSTQVHFRIGKTRGYIFKRL